MTNKIDISSTALEKSIDAAKEFLGKLMSPAVEEVGLLLRDSVALWRFKNQIRVLNKAKACCDRNNISPKAISLKLLCPLLEGAALEEDETLQDKWAILLSNMVDSEQNVENHVFPYILSQMSSNEFLVLQRVFRDKKERVRALQEELDKLRIERPSIEISLSQTIADLSSEIEGKNKTGPRSWSMEVSELQKKKAAAEEKLRMLPYEERFISRRLCAPAVLPEKECFKDFELSNVIRLGVVKSVQEVYGECSRAKIVQDSYHDPYVDVDIEVGSDESHVLTGLGELFIEACTEKKDLKESEKKAP